MMKKINFLLIFLLFPIFLFSQTGTIRGFVYEESSEEPIIFANVFIEGTDFGSVSDDNGYFIISDIPFGEYILKVSFIGYKNFEIPIQFNLEKKLITQKIFL